MKLKLVEGEVMGMDQKLIMMTQKLSRDERNMRMAFLTEQQRLKEKGESIDDDSVCFAEILLELQCQNLLLRKLTQSTNELSVQISDWRYAKTNVRAFGNTVWELLHNLLFVLLLILTVAVLWKAVA